MATLKTCSVVVLFLLCGCQSRDAPADKVQQAIEACKPHGGAASIYTGPYSVDATCKNGVYISISKGSQ